MRKIKICVERNAVLFLANVVHYRNHWNVNGVRRAHIHTHRRHSHNSISCNVISLERLSPNSIKYCSTMFKPTFLGRLAYLAAHCTHSHTHFSALHTNAMHARASHVFRLLERITYNYNWVQTELCIIPNAMDEAVECCVRAKRRNKMKKWKTKHNDHTNGANNVLDAVRIPYIWISCAAKRFSILVRRRASSDAKKVTQNRHEWVRKCRTPAPSNRGTQCDSERTCSMLKHGRMSNK